MELDLKHQEEKTMHDVNKNLRFAYITGPCQNCKERHLACHDSCPKFIEYREKIDTFNEKKREAEALNRYRRHSKGR